MTTTHSAGTRRRQLRILQLIFAGAAALAMLALFDAARPDTTHTVLGSGSVRLADTALAAPAGGPHQAGQRASRLGSCDQATDSR